MGTSEHIKSGTEEKVKNKFKKGFKILFISLLGIAVAFLFGYIVMHLWNWLMPELFGLPEIGYWKALGVLLFAKIIFGFGNGGGPNKKSRPQKRPFFNNRCMDKRRDFSKWKHYDEFWEAEGEQAYKKYLEKIRSEDNI
ncbi:hypothetical protein ACNR9Q_04480 [Maribacter sp. X9]|uniref:hypothetical protein n=1 Tax=Maribacter sp. X9 TaxID=3402159 RepID=UPI003AF36142